MTALLCASDCIYTAVDPNGGGVSEYAVASVAFIGGKHVVSVTCSLLTL